MKARLVTYGIQILLVSIIAPLASSGQSATRTDGREEPKYIKISDSLAVKIDDEKGQFSWEAAKEQCALYGKGWHSPTMIELKLLYSKKDKIGGFKGEWYWSSSEYYNEFGRSINFKTGEQNDDYEDKNHANCVRCVKTINE